MSPIPLGILASSGSAGGPYWITTIPAFYTGSNNYGVATVADDANGNILFACQMRDSDTAGENWTSRTGTGVYLAKYSKAGTKLLERFNISGGNSGTYRGYGATNGSLFFNASEALSTGGSTTRQYSFLQNASTGSMSARIMDGVGGSPFGNQYFFSSMNSSGRVAALGNQPAGIKLHIFSNTLGNVWGRIPNGINLDNNPRAVRIFDDNTVSAITISPGDGFSRFTMQKFDASGNLTLRAGVEWFAGSGYIDAVGNFYGANKTGSATEIRKFNSSGALQWGRSISATTASTNSSPKVVASYDGTAVYLLTPTSSGYSGTPRDNDLIIAKFDANGTLQWQRNFTTSTNTMSSIVSSGLYDVGATVDVSGDLIFAMLWNAEPLAIAKLSPDGGLTGTYTVGTETYIYSVSSFSVTNLGTLTVNNPTYSMTSDTPSVSTGDNVIVTATTPITTQTIG